MLPLTRRVIRKLPKLVAYSCLLGTASAAAVYLHHHDWDAGSTGIVRFGRAAGASGRIMFDYWSLWRWNDGCRCAPESSQCQCGYKDRLSKVHQRSAERLLAMCRANGGVFVKVGQHLGSLEYLLPAEYVNTMKVLQKQAPATELADVFRLIEDDLGRPVSELFSSFDAQPLGAASLAQVHRAVLRSDGRVVAVKVQHPHVRAHSQVDILTMDLLVRLVKWCFPRFQFMWLAEEMKRNLPLELNFLAEGENCERLEKLLNDADSLKVPEIDWHLSSHRVLTMEFCDGCSVDDRAALLSGGVVLNDVTQLLARLYSRMIFVHGFVHCDPHPGNILVRKHARTGRAQLVLLDHGLYTQLSDEFRLNYCRFWMALLRRDMADIQRYAERLNCGDLHHLLACVVTARSWQSVSDGLMRQSNKITDAEVRHIQAYSQRNLVHIADLLNRVPRQMLLLFKTNDLLRSIEWNLQRRANSVGTFLAMSRCCLAALYEHEIKLLYTSAAAPSDGAGQPAAGRLQTAVARLAHLPTAHYVRHLALWAHYRWRLSLIAFYETCLRIYAFCNSLQYRVGLIFMQ